MKKTQEKGVTKTFDIKACSKEVRTIGTEMASIKTMKGTVTVTLDDLTEDTLNHYIQLVADALVDLNALKERGASTLAKQRMMRLIAHESKRFAVLLTDEKN